MLLLEALFITAHRSSPCKARMFSATLERERSGDCKRRARTPGRGLCSRPPARNSALSDRTNPVSCTQTIIQEASSRSELNKSLELALYSDWRNPKVLRSSPPAVRRTVAAYQT